MNPRTRKYLDRKKADDGQKKGSANIEGYDEQHPKEEQEPKENPAPTPTEERQQQEISKATSDNPESK